MRVSVVGWQIVLLVAFCLMSASLAQDKFPDVFNTQAAGEHPPSPEEMLRLIELPEGFNATLYAAEPDVRQPIAMDFDDRGRLWVAENYSYSGGPYETKLRDRVIVLEDKNGDGRHDKRTVFWDQGFMLTSVTWGFGGVWVLNDGELLFIPDRNGDDIPDSAPEVKLDGFSKECGHNFVSGLTWGPNGWLYARHGIVDTSYPAAPGTPKEDRVRMNCGIWRYHPISHEVEIVCQGTTNPWGLDYNEAGQFFMTNNVQGHLWHVIPGAHFKRMYGQDFNPHLYELMDMSADHYHWDTKGRWSESRDGKANDLGGGHSHVGGLIYQGTNFPSTYRGKIFMCNTHGRRINVNRLERHGSGYVGRREPDFMLVKTPWFRGVDLKMGPDGSIYVADWSDNGECHDHDGVHRTSGRIYRISYGEPALREPNKLLTQLSSDELLSLTHSRNAFESRRASRILQERQLTPSRLNLTKIAGAETVSKLLLIEALGLTTSQLLKTALTQQDADYVEQTVYLATSTLARRKSLLNSLIQLARSAPPPNVLLALISGLQRYEPEQRLSLMEAIFETAENCQRIAEDENLTLMAWFGVEGIVKEVKHVQMLAPVKKLQQFAVRRIASEWDNAPQVASELLKHIAVISTADDVRAVAMIHSARAGLAGRAKVVAPVDWQTIEAELRKSKSVVLRQEVDALAALFGDGTALTELRLLAKDAGADTVSREAAIKTLAQARDHESATILFGLLNDRAVADVAIAALAILDHPDTAEQLLKRLPNFKDGNRELAIDALTGRLASAQKLIEAIEQERVSARELSAIQVRQLLAFGDQRIRAMIEQRWGIVQDSSQAKLAALAHWRTELSPTTLASASLEKGAVLFKKSCANCHKLFGEGQTIGPDLTGSNRGNLEFVLGNTIDPSSVVPKQFTTSVIGLRDGRVITGVIVSETAQGIVVQTDKEQLSIAQMDIEQSRNTGKSLMPDGLLDNLTPSEVRDLVAFIMQRQ